MGVINAANNITLYAISAQVIGPMLDAGGCRNKNMGPAVHTGAYWTLDESCTVDSSHPGNTINQKDDLICIRGDGIGNITQSCTLTHTVKVGEGADRKVIENVQALPLAEKKTLKVDL